jgi:centromere/kinetochore protein ZW10
MVLNKSKYYSAVGSIVDGAICRMMEDILGLNDIPEVESHRLAELCRILNAVEGLFIEDREQASRVECISSI